MCSAPATTKEHVPPRCLFPATKDIRDGLNYRHSLITVPSCKTHNTMKSHDDEFLLYTLTTNLTANNLARQLYFTKVKRSINYRPNLIQRILKHRMPIRADDMTTGSEIQTIAYKVDNVRLCRILDHIARALYYHVYNKQCKCDLIIDPEFMLKIEAINSKDVNDNIDQDRKLIASAFNNVEIHGANPDVFQYQVITVPNMLGFSMRLYFYGGCIVNINPKNTDCITQ